MLSMRQATMCDRGTILGLRPAVFSGQDYLPVYIDHFFKSRERICMLCEKENEVVGFLVLFFIDGGESCVLQTARVRKDVEGEGVYSFMVKFCRNIAKEKGAKQTIVGNASLLKMYTKQLAKDQCDTIAHLEIISSFLGPQDYDKLINLPVISLHKLTGTDVGSLFQDPRIADYLFPDGRMVVDWVPYKTIDKNTCLLDGAYTKYYSDVKVQGHSVTGLLSAWTFYDIQYPDQLHVIDFFGTDIGALQQHLNFYLKTNANIVKDLSCSVQIHLQDKDLASECLRTLKALGVSRYKWSDGVSEDGVYYMTFFETSLTLSAPKAKTGDFTDGIAQD